MSRVSSSTSRVGRALGLALGLALVLAGAWWPARTLRAAPAEYMTDATWSLSFPKSDLSFGTSVTAFDTSATQQVGGQALAGRMLAVTGREVYLQAAIGHDEWQVAARLADSDEPMDPCFVTLTPDASAIGLGTGLDLPLYVFPTALLDVENPPTLTGHADVARFDLSYYDGVFRDSRYLYVNAGTSNGSAIFVVDTWDEGAAAIEKIIGPIPGASAGLAFDRDGNLVTGIGYDPNYVRTGEIRIFSAAEITQATDNGQLLDYDADGSLLATDMLSAASLGFDGEGNLFVGGGDVFGTSGNYGYANLIDASVVTRVLQGGMPLDPTAPGELERIAPDPCMNDDATSVVYVAALDMLLVSANLASTPPNCASTDVSGATAGVSPIAKPYFAPDAPDMDADGIPDGIDFENAPVFGRAQLERFVAAFQAGADDANYDAESDFDRDGAIDWNDYATLRKRWGLPLDP